MISTIVAEELRRKTPGSGSDAQPSAWSEADEAALQATLGREAYLELMAATEEVLLRELGGDLPTDELGGDDHQFTQSAAAAREYEEFIAAQAESFEDEDDGFGEDAAVLCPLCVRSTLVHKSDGFIVCRRESLGGTSAQPTWKQCGESGGCTLRLDARGHLAPLELLRERMDVLLREHSQRCTGQACCRLPQPAEQSLGMLLFCCTTCGTTTGVV